MEKKTKKLEWKIGSVILIAIFGLFIWGIVSYFYVGSPKEIISMADQFKPGTEWKLRQDFVEPPRNSCIDKVCPSVSRSWDIPHKLNREQFEQIARMGNTKLTITPDCFEQFESGHFSEMCDTVDTLDGYYIELSYYGGKGQDKPKVTLYVIEER